ncbi:MAG: SDR family oxidoreductase [Chloroflexi bacterium]|nr:SDR family oxidoreductase [Chloroflexota bacterium]
MGVVTGRRAIVTGAASGIGRATAELLAAEGARVVLADVDAARGEAAASSIRDGGGDARFVRCDVTSEADCQAVVAEAARAFGGLDILCNNAGIIRRATVVETTPEEWARVLAVNLTSVFLMSRAAIPVMAAGDGGAIVNTGSGWGLKGGDQAAAYCASKGGVVNLTRAMAIDHGPQRIRVNCVCPGDTDTAMLRDEARQLGHAEGAFLEAAAERPLARLGLPEDVARAILFLVSEASGWVTGTTLVVDGGGLA